MNNKKKSPIISKNVFLTPILLIALLHSQSIISSENKIVCSADIDTSIAANIIKEIKKTKKNN